MVTDGSHHSGYDPQLIGTVLGEAAHLLRHLGFTAHHTVLIGGVVPSLLILDPATNHAHFGTTDLDLCLSVAIVEGDTAEYERIENALRAAGYEPTDQTFRWHQSARMRLDVEFFCPAGDGRPPGKMFRPKAATNPTAKQNFGPKLTAIALDAGQIIGDDAVIVTRQVDLPDRGGQTTFDFRVTGPLGFLVAKVGALTGRDKPKDAYDIVWIIENWDGGPAGIPAAIAASPAFTQTAAHTALAQLAAEFAVPSNLGPSSYVRFMATETMTGDDRTRLARQAVGAVTEMHRALGLGR